MDTELSEEERTVFEQIFEDSVFSDNADSLIELLENHPECCIDADKLFLHWNRSYWREAKFAQFSNRFPEIFPASFIYDKLRSAVYFESDAFRRAVEFLNIAIFVCNVRLAAKADEVAFVLIQGIDYCGDEDDFGGLRSSFFATLLTLHEFFPNEVRKSLLLEFADEFFFIWRKGIKYALEQDDEGLATVYFGYLQSLSQSLPEVVSEAEVNELVSGVVL